VHAGCPEEDGGQEHHTGCAEGVVSISFVKDAEQGDMTAQREKGEEQGVDVKIIEGQVIKKNVYPLYQVVGQVGQVFVLHPEGCRISEQEVSGEDAIAEEKPYISLLRKIPVGDPIMYTSCRGVQCEKADQYNRADIPEKRAPGQYPA